MSNGTEKDTGTSDKIGIVQGSEVLFTEQQAIIQSLKQELEVSKKKVNELQDSMRRLAADFDNYKKWAAKERQTTQQTAAESLIKKLLDIYESLEKAVSAVNDTTGSEFKDGIELIYKEFSRILKSEGLEPIPSVGVPLDVYRHEVLMKEESDKPDETILEEFQKGYMLNDKVLRHSKVKISGQ